MTFKPSFLLDCCLELISEKYEEVHRSQDGLGIKTLDFFVKKKTDHYNNLINT